jgi:hypothetical protein
MKFHSETNGKDSDVSLWEQGMRRLVQFQIYCCKCILDVVEVYLLQRCFHVNENGVNYSVTCFVTRCGVWIGYWIYWTLKTLTTKDYSAIANLHTLQITTAHTTSSISSLGVAWQRIPLMLSASVPTSLPAGYHSQLVLNWPLTGYYLLSKSKLLYDRRPVGQ